MLGTGSVPYIEGGHYAGDTQTVTIADARLVYMMQGVRTLWWTHRRELRLTLDDLFVQIVRIV